MCPWKASKERWNLGARQGSVSERERRVVRINSKATSISVLGRARREHLPHRQRAHSGEPERAFKKVGLKVAAKGSQAGRWPRVKSNQDRWEGGVSHHFGQRLSQLVSMTLDLCLPLFLSNTFSYLLT